MTKQRNLETVVSEQEQHEFVEMVTEFNNLKEEVKKKEKLLKQKKKQLKSWLRKRSQGWGVKGELTFGEMFIKLNLYKGRSVWPDKDKIKQHHEDIRKALEKLDKIKKDEEYQNEKEFYALRLSVTNIGEQGE